MIIAHTEECKKELRINQLFSDKENFTIRDTLVIDLLNIFLEIYTKDISIKRKGNNPRNLIVNIYVDKNNLKLWQENCNLIEKLSNFVTEGDGDKWTIHFIPAEYEYDERNMDLNSLGINNISLLSGGLDSFCGAYLNEVSHKKTIYCGYKTSNVDTSAITRISSFLNNREGNMGIYTYTKVSKKKNVYTQRTRSLLFFTLAVLTALNEKVKEVNVNENGIMTLNPSFQSRGTTKTTHPKTIYLYQKILNNVGINVKINHPFLFTTKGEMVNSLNDIYKSYIKDTRSCSRSLHDPRYDTSSTVSCGTCVPCLLRKISIAAYNLEEYDNNYIVPYEGNMNDEEYRSSLFYYQTFYDAIKSNLIFSELIMKKEYYELDDYYEMTYKMLNCFAEEFEIFIKKYSR